MSCSPPALSSAEGLISPANIIERAVFSCSVEHPWRTRSLLLNSDYVPRASGRIGSSAARMRGQRRCDLRHGARNRDQRHLWLSYTTGTCEKLSDHRQGRRRGKGCGIRCVLLTSNLSSAPQAEADTVNGLRHCRRVVLNKTG